MRGLHSVYYFPLLPAKTHPAESYEFIGALIPHSLQRRQLRFAVFLSGRRRHPFNVAVIAFPHFCFRRRIILADRLRHDLLHPGPHLITDQLLIRRAEHVSGHLAKRTRNKQSWAGKLRGHY